MNFKYKLTMDDLITNQLYIASFSKNIKRKRLLSWLIVPVIYLILGIIFYFIDKKGLLAVFSVIAVLWIIFYPLYLKILYKNHYKKHIKENYSKINDYNISLTLIDDFIQLKDESGESKIRISEIDRINEISTHYFIKFKLNSVLTLPKQTIPEESLNSLIKILIEKHHIQLNRDLKWKWK